MDQATWRLILLKLEPVDVLNLCASNSQLRSICSDESFYREYFQVRNRIPPPRINLADYYFSYYSYLTQAQKWIEYLKYELFFHFNAWDRGLRLLNDDIQVKMDASLFEHIENNFQQIRRFFEELQKINESLEEQAAFAITDIILTQEKEFGLQFSLYIPNLEFADFWVILSEDQTAHLIAKLLFRGIKFYGIENTEEITLPV